MKNGILYNMNSVTLADHYYHVKPFTSCSTLWVSNLMAPCLEWHLREASQTPIWHTDVEDETKMSGAMGWLTICQKVKVKLLSHVWLCDPMDCNLPGSSVHRILQTRILEWVAISFSRGFSQSRDRTRATRIEGRRLTVTQGEQVIAADFD